MKVLVAHASRHGATAEIAERIASTITDRGHEAHAEPVDEVTDLNGYGAVVLGGAAYMFHWLRSATAFARKHRRELSATPVWLFSSGPLGTDTVDKRGRDVLRASRPKEFDELNNLLHPVGEVVFYGAYDPAQEPVGLAERLMRRSPGKGSVPTGDFRDWGAIEDWAGRIADRLDDAA